jgi:hypothetical protein
MPSSLRRCSALIQEGSTSARRLVNLTVSYLCAMETLTSSGTATPSASA